MLVEINSSSISVDVFFANDAGAGQTGKTAADFPACKWSAGNNTTDTTLTLSDLASLTTAHPNNNVAGGVFEREGGWYRLDLPNNMFTASGRRTLTFAESTDKRILAPLIEVGSFAVTASATQTVNAAGDHFYHYFTTRGTSGPEAATGLVLSWTKDGAAVTPSGGVTLTHIANGRYLLDVDTSVDPTTFTDDSDYGVWVSAGTVDGVSIIGEVVHQFRLEAPTLGNELAETISDLVISAIRGVRVYLSSPLSQSGRKLEIIVGDAYDDDNGNPISFTFSGAPDVTGKVCTLGIGYAGEAAIVTAVGTIVTSGLGDQTVKFELTQLQTLDLNPDDKYEYSFDVQYGVSPTKPRTISRGECLTFRKWT